MTLTEMTSAMRRDLSTIETAQTAEKAAEATYRYNTHRAHFLSDEAYEAGLRDYLLPVTEAREASQRAAEAARRNARVVLHQTESARLVVTPDEQESAARQEPVIRRVVDGGNLPAIRDELRAAIIAEDRAAMLLFATMLPDRLAKPAPEEAQRPELGQVRGEIVRMLSQARDTLRDQSFDPVRKLASEANARAGEVSAAAHRRRSEAAQAADLASGRKVAWPADPSLRAS